MRDDFDPRVAGAAPRPTRPVDPDEIWRTARRRDRRRVVVASVATAAVAAIAITAVAGELAGPQPATPVIDQPADEEARPPSDEGGLVDEEQPEVEVPEGEVPDEPDEPDTPPGDSESDDEGSGEETAAPTEPEPTDPDPGEPDAERAPAPGEQHRSDKAIDELWGRTFVSVDLSEDGQPRELVGDSRIELTFEENEHTGSPGMRWWAGCNYHGTGEFRVTDEHLSVGQVGGTDIGCAPEHHAQDEWLNDLLQRGAHWRRDGDRLVLEGDGTRIEFTEGEETRPS